MDAPRRRCLGLSGAYEKVGVVERRRCVVNRTRPHDHHEPGIAALERGRDRRPRVRYDIGGLLAYRDFFEKDRRRDERPDLRDPEVVCPLEHVSYRLVHVVYAL